MGKLSQETPPPREGEPMGADCQCLEVSLCTGHCNNAHSIVLQQFISLQDTANLQPKYILDMPCQFLSKLCFPVDWQSVEVTTVCTVLQHLMSLCKI